MKLIAFGLLGIIFLINLVWWDVTDEFKKLNKKIDEFRNQSRERDESEP